MYTALIENLRWQAAYHRCDAETAKAAAVAIEKLKASCSQVTDTLRLSGFGSFEELLASYRQVNAERAELIRLLKERAECELCKHDRLPLPCAELGLHFCESDCCGFEKIVCCGCEGRNWEWRGLQERDDK